MSKHNLKTVHGLIHTLSKSEKRNLKLYAKRNYSVDKELMYLKMFDILEKSMVFNEKKFKLKLAGFTPHQISDLKGQLFNHILRSLRILYRKKPEFKIREIIEFAQILYKKKFFKLSLEQLKKAKKLAVENQSTTLMLEVLEFEKNIESRHVTRSHSATASNLATEIEKTRLKLKLETEWSDLSLILYDKFLKIGHVKNEREHAEVKLFFEKRQPENDILELRTYYSNLNRFKSLVWYNYIIQDFKSSYRHCLGWLKLKEDFPVISRHDLFEVIKSYHNCLSSLFYCADAKRHHFYYQELSEYIEENEKEFDLNTQQVAFIYLESARINNFMLQGKFREASLEIERINGELSSEWLSVDIHRVMVFKYKFASVHFSLGENKRCIRYLADIINLSDSSLREDVQCFSRILNLVAHFELNNDDHLFYLVKSVYRFLIKMKSLQKVQIEFIKFLKKSVYMDRQNLRADFIELRKNLLEIQKDKFEIRPFLYLDIISWLDSKIESKLLEQAVRDNLNQM